MSVWDLEQVEEDARERGGYAVWETEGQQIIEEDNQARMKGLYEQLRMANAALLQAAEDPARVREPIGPAWPAGPPRTR